MHRQTVLTAGFVGFTSGGARSLVNTINDKTGMQEMKGTFMKDEGRDRIESPQNYGFTSVVKEATQGSDGSVDQCAEAYISFMGGNRSFPVAGVMDDRRYRLKELKPGDTAFYDHQQQQLHMNEDGTFLTGLNEKKVRLQLADVDQQQQQGGNTASQRDAGSGSGGTGSSGSSGQKLKGQTARYKKDSKRFVDINKSTVDINHDATINVTAGSTINLKAGTINYTAKNVFHGDVWITGELRVHKSIYTDETGYKPGDGPWDDGMANVPGTLAAPPQAMAGKVTVGPDGSVVIDGDFTVTGNLTVNGVVRAKGFERVA